MSTSAGRWTALQMASVPLETLLMFCTPFVPLGSTLMPQKMLFSFGRLERGSLSSLADGSAGLNTVPSFWSRTRHSIAFSGQGSVPWRDHQLSSMGDRHHGTSNQSSPALLIDPQAVAPGTIHSYTGQISFISAVCDAHGLVRSTWNGIAWFML